MLKFIWSAALVSFWSLTTAQYTNTYYVTSSASNASCPGNPCYTLNTYLQNSIYYFQSSTQFVFLPGVHAFDTGIPLVVEGKQNLRLVGSNNFTRRSIAEKVKEYGFVSYREDKDITFLQSSAIIVCNNVSGFNFSNITNLSLINISVVNCGQGSQSSILLTNVSNLFVDGVSILNSTGYGLLGLNVLGESLITRSSFIANNQYVKEMLIPTNVGNQQQCGDAPTNIAYVNNGSIDCSTLIGGNVLIHFNDAAFVLSSNQLNLSQLVFSLGLDGTFGPGVCDYNYVGTGLSIVLEQANYNVNIEIASSVFYRNQASVGSNVFFACNSSASNNFTMLNTHLIRGLAFSSGAGAQIKHFNSSSTMISVTGLTLECNSIMLSKSQDNGTSLDIDFVNPEDRRKRNFQFAVRLSSVEFRNNFGFSSLHISFSSLISVHYYSSIEIINCTFADKLEYSIYAKSCNFSRNPIISLLGSQIRDSNVKVVSINFFVTNVTFTNSKFSALNGNAECRGRVVFQGRYSEDNGGALHLSSTSLTVGANSNVMIMNNTALYGGAIYFDAQSNVMFVSPCNVSFVNNKALLQGGALYVQRRQLRECFFKVNNSAGIPFDSHFGINVSFEGSYAGQSGSILYGGDIVNCAVDRTMIPSPYDTSITPEMLLNLITTIGSNDNSSVLISSDPLSVCTCDYVCSASTWINRTGYPGQSVDLSFVTLGQLNSTTPSVVILYSILPTIEINEVIYTGKQCTYYTVKFGCKNVTMIFSTELALSEDLLTRNEIKLSLTVNLSCPVGFELVTNSTCACNSMLRGYGFTCDIQNEALIKPGNEWVGLTQDNALGIIGQCPFDYCSDNTIVSLHGFDDQCNYQRADVLCGRCKENFSMTLGSSQCAACSNYYLILVIPFAIMGIALVAFLFGLNLTVLSGTLNGITFYVSVFRINDKIFFPENQRIDYRHYVLVPIAWLNLDVGIKSCFYNGMESIGKTWLQFVFPSYILLLVGIVVVVGRYSSTVAKINAVPVFATLIQLSYSKILRCIITIFSFSRLNTSNSSIINVWIYDGSVRLFEGSHIALFVFGAIITIFFVAPYSLLLLLAPFLQTWSHRPCLNWINKFKPFLDCHYAPFKDRYRFWSGVLLIIRFPLYLVFILTEWNSYKLWVIVIVTYLYVIALITLSVYKKWIVTLWEVVLLLNLSTLCVVVLLNPTGSRTGQDIVTALVIIALVTIMVTIGYQAAQKMHLKKRALQILRPHLTKALEEEKRPLLSDAPPVQYASNADSTRVLQNLPEDATFREVMLDD